MKKVTIEQAARAIVICLKANLPVALWSEPGAGKSSIVAQIAKKLSWELDDVRLSDKEPSDFALPFPNDPGQGQARELSYLMSDLLPWKDERNADNNRPSILFFDEFDRASMAVQNMALQLILDRRCFGRDLNPEARLVLAGNQSSDIGTNQLSEAAATRMVHLYLDTTSEGALEAWSTWAEGADVSETLRSFAKFRKDIWAGEERNDLIEYAKPTKRTWVMADEIHKVSKTVNFPVEDILRPLIEGCVGAAAANELLGWIRLSEDAPKADEIREDPTGTRLPSDVGISYALSLHLISEAKRDGSAIGPFLIYANRWGSEQKAFFFRKMAEALPSIQTLKIFQDWEKNRLA
jgi:MoxR-like ATPase